MTNNDPKLALNLKHTYTNKMITRELLKEFRNTNSELYNYDQLKKPPKIWKPPTDLPDKINSFIGQDKIKDAIEIAIVASCKENKPLDHMLFYGPPGFGKTKISELIIDILQVPAMRLTGKSVSRNSEFMNLVNFIQNGDPYCIIFIDELHCINKAISEELFSMVQNFTYRDDSIQPFTLLGATTDIGLVQKPLRDRFKYLFKFDRYTDDELKGILLQTDRSLSDDIITYLVERCKGTPRILLNYYNMVKNVSIYDNGSKINMEHCIFAMDLSGIDRNGLTQTDIDILLYLKEVGKPVGKSTLSMALNIPELDLLNIIEPWLLQQKYITRTPRGREITSKGRAIIKNL